MADEVLKDVRLQKEKERAEAYADLRGYLDKVLKPSQYEILKGETGPNSKPVEGASSDVIEPIYNLAGLTQMYEISGHVAPLVNSLVNNTVGFGWRIIPRDRQIEAPEAERFQLLNFLNYVNADQDFTALMRDVASDYFLTGNAWVEVTRNKKGEPDGLYRARSYQMRLTKLEAKNTVVHRKQVWREESGHRIVDRKERKRFRRYREEQFVTAIGESDVNDGGASWFKEFGDPRDYSARTGKAPDPNEPKASEMIHIHPTLTRGAYGLPFHIGNVYSIYGTQAAERINFTTFTNNNIPSFIITVSDGGLTAGSVARIKEFVETMMNSDNRSRFLVLESEGSETDMDVGKSRIDFKPMHDARINDAMFLEYLKYSHDAIRTAHRLPKTLMGEGEIKTRAEVLAAMYLAEQQTFVHTRNELIDWLNRFILPELGISNFIVEFNTTDVTDPALLVNMLRDAEKTGGVTPEISRWVIERVLSQSFGSLGGDGDSQEFSTKIPFTLTMAERVKKINDAGANNPTGSQESETVMTEADQTEPTQTITSER